MLVGWLVFFFVRLCLWLLVLRLGSGSQSRRCFFCVCVWIWTQILHVLVQNTASAPGKDNCALPDLKRKGIFLLLGGSTC